MEAAIAAGYTGNASRHVAKLPLPRVVAKMRAVGFVSTSSRSLQ
jgi:hypothetical protein